MTSTGLPLEGASVTQADELTLKVARQLEVDWQYVERVDAGETARIAAVRSAGRKAGRLLGFKIASVQTAPDDENLVTVVVVVREAPGSDEDKRLAERARVLMNEAWSKSRPL